MTGDWSTTVVSVTCGTFVMRSRHAVTPKKRGKVLGVLVLTCRRVGSFGHWSFIAPPVSALAILQLPRSPGPYETIETLWLITKVYDPIRIDPNQKFAHQLDRMFAEDLRGGRLTACKIQGLSRQTRAQASCMGDGPDEFYYVHWTGCAQDGNRYCSRRGRSFGRGNGSWARPPKWRRR